MQDTVPRIVWFTKERALVAEANTISLDLLENRIIDFIGLNHLKEEYTNNTLFGSLILKREEMPSVCCFVLLSQKSSKTTVT